MNIKTTFDFQEKLYWLGNGEILCGVVDSIGINANIDRPTQENYGIIVLEKKSPTGKAIMWIDRDKLFTSKELLLKSL